MNEIICIEPEQIQVKDHEGLRVVTFADIDRVHGRREGTASRNFRENRDRFDASRDYFEISQTDEKRRFAGPGAGAGKALIVLTERGYLKVVKSLKDDLAWTVYGRMVDVYFAAVAGEIPADPKALAAAEVLRLRAEREARLGRNQKAGGLMRLAALGPKLALSADVVASLEVEAAATLAGKSPSQYMPALPGGEWLSPSDIAKREGRSPQAVGLAVSRCGVRGKAEYCRTILNTANEGTRTVSSHLYNEAGVALIVAELRAPGSGGLPNRLPAGSETN